MVGLIEEGAVFRRIRGGEAGTAFAAKLGISPQSLSDLERGRRRAGRRTVEKFAAVLGVPPSDVWRMLEGVARG